MKGTRSGSPVLRALWWLAFVIFMLGLIWLGLYFLQTTSQERAISELSAFVHGTGDSPGAASTNGAVLSTGAIPHATDDASDGAEASSASGSLSQSHVNEYDGQYTSPPGASEEPTPSVTDARHDPIALRYRELKAMNADFTGWIRIDGTRVDYPVMHSPAVPERYLNRDFSGNYSFSGLPFLDAICSADDAPGNSIIYGHNMRGGGIFGDLQKYRRREYLDENPIIKYDTLQGCGEYKVMAVLDLYASRRDAASMLCYRLIDTDDAEAVEALNEYIQKRALLRSEDAEARLGDRLLTLSTCAYNDDRRLIVIARRIAYMEFE